MSVLFSAQKKIFILSLATTFLTTTFCSKVESFQLSNFAEDNFLTAEFPINNVPTIFIIDTGSNFNFITPDSEIIQLLEDTEVVFSLPEIAPIEAPVSSGSITAGSVETELNFAVSDSMELPEGVSGVLGSDYFNATGFSLDNSVLSINPDFPVTKIGQGTSARLVTTIPVAGSKGTQDVKFLIDTGAPVTIVTEEVSDSVGLEIVIEKGSPKTVVISGGATGESPVKKGNLADLGPIPLVVNDSLKKGLPEGISGLLGLNALGENFNLSSTMLTITTPEGEVGNSEIKKVTVEKIPEPLTILGSLASLGFGVLLKRREVKEKLD